MRALYSLIAVLLFTAAVWLGIRHANRIYCRLVLNKATHEFLNHKEKVAIGRAIALLERNPTYKPALEAAIVWLVTDRQFDRARSLVHDYATTLTLSPQTRYHLAICAYERGDVNQAVGLCETLTSPTRPGADIPTPLITAYLSMVRGDFNAARTQLESAGSRFDQNLWYHSLFGRICYGQEDFMRATEELGLAVGQGAQNPRTRLQLAICKALQGDIPAMEMLLDKLAAESQDAYAQARSEIELWLARAKARGAHVSPMQQTVQRERVLHLRLALAAILVHQGLPAEASDMLAALRHDFPEHIGLATRRGLFFERAGRQDLASKFYREEADRLLVAAYKTATLDSLTSVEMANAVLKRFLTTGSVVLDAGTMNPSAGHAIGQGWAMPVSGEIWQTFPVPATGRYALDLLARGEAAGGIWPIVEIYFDGKKTGDLYINSPVWDLFEIHLPLSAGMHWLRILYVNNAVESDVKGDRNLYLDKVIVRPEPK